MSKQRLLGLDVMRTVAAIGVIYIHVDFDGTSWPTADLYIRSLVRWCVPVFFLLSGYFIRSQGGIPEIRWPRIRKVLIITLAANLLYLPVFLMRGGIGPEGIRILYDGTMYHLWFLNALLFGLVFLKFYFRIVRSTLLFAALSGFLLIALHVADYLAAAGNDGLLSAVRALRFLQGVPLLWIGSLLATVPHLPRERSLAAGLTVLGTAICLAEAINLSANGTTATNPQFPWGTAFMTLGILFLFRSWKAANLERVAALGRDHSLMVYILHPIYILFVTRGGAAAGLSPDAIALILALTAPLVAFLMAVALARWLPPVSQLLSGSLPEFSWSRRERAGRRS